MPANRFAGRYKGGLRIALCSKTEASGNITMCWKAWWGVRPNVKQTSYAVQKYGFDMARKLALRAAKEEKRV